MHGEPADNDPDLRSDDILPVRIPPLPREEWTDAARDVFAFWGDEAARETGSPINLTMVQAQHPALAQAYNTFGRHLLLDSTLPVRPRELVVLRTAWLMKGGYEWHYHVGYALKAGLTLAEVAAIRVGADDPAWQAQPADRAVLATVDELWRTSRLGDDGWQALTDHFDRRQVMDLVFTIGNYVMLTWAINAFGVQIEHGADRIGWNLQRASGAPIDATMRPGETS